MPFTRSGCCLLVAGLLPWGAIARADSRASPPEKPTGSVELGLDHSSLTAGYPQQNNTFLRAVLQGSARDTWMGEISHQSEFGDQGTFFSVRDTHNFNPDWYTNFSVGSSAGGFFLPRLRVDGALNKKWLRQRPLITTIGMSYSAAKDTHRDMGFSLGATYYFRSPWILEGGILWNRSTPGGVVSRSQFLALTQGQNHRHYLTLRVSAGREAYEIIGPASVLADFPSHEVSLTWRVWVRPSWGLSLTGSYYHNPSYDRKGIAVGTFREF